MHCLVCFGIGTKYRCLGIKTVKAVCVCVYSVYFVLSSAKREGRSEKMSRLRQPDSQQTMYRLARPPEAQVTHVRAKIN